ncbi:MAG TPA: aldo/keto reductase [Candidatus Acidoferrales bacterium]|nr:aldo/keto reductase [Candidatus Acidoferrales bacterium]
MEPSIPLRPLGRSGVRVPALGVGTNRWGRGRGVDQLAPVFSAALDAGANLFDTAEVYLGSEKTIGACLRRDPRPALVVTKFAPYPTRLSTRALDKALDGSLARLGTHAVDLYLIHFPFSLVGIPSLMDRLAEAVQAGKARAVGVSNFSARQMLVAAERLERHGVPLAAAEVQFSVFHRGPERNGVLAACRELDVALIAYRPLAGGRTRRDGTALDRTLAGIARARQKTVAQVALTWLLGKDERVVAIPGATSVEHLRENVGAAGWTLGDEELAALERSSA